MADIDHLKGATLPSHTVVVERSAVSHFATAVTDTNPVFRDPAAAAAAGLDAIPVPPTFNFVMHNWGAFGELQPDGQPDTNPFNVALGALMKEGGLLLHGGQEFTYARPVVVGDVLTSAATLSDITSKTNKAGKPMTFLVTDTRWSDANGNEVVTSKMTLIFMGRTPKA